MQYQVHNTSCLGNFTFLNLKGLSSKIKKCLLSPFSTEPFSIVAQTRNQSHFPNNDAESALKNSEVHAPFEIHLSEEIPLSARTPCKQNMNTAAQKIEDVL